MLTITATIMGGIFEVDGAAVDIMQPIAEFMLVAANDIHDVICIPAYVEEAVCKADVASVGCHSVVSTLM